MTNMVGFSEELTPVNEWGRRPTVLFVHAHPDDEAIFTGGTLAALSLAGYRTVVLIATSGELGERPLGDDLAGLARTPTLRGTARL